MGVGLGVGVAVGLGVGVGSVPPPATNLKVLLVDRVSESIDRAVTNEERSVVDVTILY